MSPGDTTSGVLEVGAFEMQACHENEFRTAYRDVVHVAEVDA